MKQFVFLSRLTDLLNLVLAIIRRMFRGYYVGVTYCNVYGGWNCASETVKAIEIYA